uniref:non-specific serine/threonine protein kinase n=1 Tax=Eutreptiella gymnastica TaxID=73025 RepID=A0A7S1N974_9EUGL|mmetsp:Transcript_137002/g.238173  ORF Transcript_137002/g.238173 Transcript_137002/m.238173 type:complete len:663 (+) Transcript_137002:151-2139(+)
MNPVYEEMGYEQGWIAGRGSYGQAVVLRRWKDGLRCLAKETKLSTLQDFEREAVKREADLLRSLDHPNIVHFFDSFEVNETLYIIMEYAARGDFEELIECQREKIAQKECDHWQEPQVMAWFVQLCLALKHLHDRKILHRDLKTGNIFLTNAGVVKLGDFGLSTTLSSTVAYAQTQCGTPFYFSPELCRNEPYNNKTDIWALGCIFYEICTLRPPFEGKSMKMLVHRILMGSYTALPDFYSPGLHSLQADLFQQDHHMRPGINDILNKPHVGKWLIACHGALSGDQPAQGAAAAAAQAAVPARAIDPDKDVPSLQPAGLTAADETPGDTECIVVPRTPLAGGTAESCTSDGDHWSISNEALRQHVARRLSEASPLRNEVDTIQLSRSMLDGPPPSTLSMLARRRRDRDPFDSTGTMEFSHTLGTRFGQTEESHVSTREFEPEPEEYWVQEREKAHRSMATMIAGIVVDGAKAPPGAEFFQEETDMYGGTMQGQSRASSWSDSGNAGFVSPGFFTPADTPGARSYVECLSPTPVTEDCPGSSVDDGIPHENGQEGRVLFSMDKAQDEECVLRSPTSQPDSLWCFLRNEVGEEHMQMAQDLLEEEPPNEDELFDSVEAALKDVKVPLSPLVAKLARSGVMRSMDSELWMKSLALPENLASQASS